MPSARRLPERLVLGRGTVTTNRPVRSDFHARRCSTTSPPCSVTSPIENIQDVLGHSSPTITKLIYVEVTERVQRGAVDRLDYLFEDADG
ncbi:hypothetical protein [Actinopolymorpha sp. B11F2]|uniref:hypothetical protein n=1 Tax=Actinopolymorpha sp. B11F2 TaxID=3160862 RepID=UPI0032E4F58C